MFLRIPFIAMLVSSLLFAVGCQQSDTSSTDPSTPPNETFWQLLDDSNINVKLTPWPIKADTPVRISVEATMGDWAEESVLTEQVYYAITTTESAAVTNWKPLRKDPSSWDEKKFSVETRFPAGTVYLHFDARAPVFDKEARERGGPYKLDPWKLTVH